jgi:shikimate kinase
MMDILKINQSTETLDSSSSSSSNSYKENGAGITNFVTQSNSNDDTNTYAPTKDMTNGSDIPPQTHLDEKNHHVYDDASLNSSLQFNLNVNLEQPPANMITDNIILIGMMGSGKTTIGKALAKYLNRSFFDLDHEIENYCGTDVATIFALEGEAGFRRRETEILKKLLQTHSKMMILATGGGAILQLQNQEILKKNGVIFYLNATVDELWRRTRYDKRRPLLANSDPFASLEEIYHQRRPIYQKIADFCVDTMHNQLDRVLVDITKILNQTQGLKKE